MQNTLFYCMSNRQLRNIVYACGKSQQSRNKAAAILRLRKNSKQLKADTSGFSVTFGKEKHKMFPYVPVVLTYFQMYHKGNLKTITEEYNYKPSYNFSSLTIDQAGSLCLQGRTGFYKYTMRNKFVYQIRYKSGKRRRSNKITRPRKRIEVSEEVPCCATRQQPAKKIVEVATTCGLNSVPDVGLKPTRANKVEIIASVIHSIVGLIQTMPRWMKILLLYIFFYFVIRFTYRKMLVHYVVMPIFIFMLWLIYKIIKFIIMYIINGIIDYLNQFHLVDRSFKTAISDTSPLFLHTPWSDN